MSPETIKQFEKSIDSRDDLIRIDSSKFNKLIKKIKQIGKSDGSQKIFLVPMYIREVFFAIANQTLFNFSVICEEEIISPYSLKIIGTL